MTRTRLSVQVAVSYSNLATALDAAKDYKGAIEVVEKGMRILECLQTSPEQSEDFDAATVNYYTAVLQANLGAIHLNNGEGLVLQANSSTIHLSNMAVDASDSM